MTQDYQSLASLLFPEGLLEYFELTSYTKEGEALRFNLSEKNVIPEEYKGKKLLSKGF